MAEQIGWTRWFGGLSKWVIVFGLALAVGACQTQSGGGGGGDGGTPPGGVGAVCDAARPCDDSLMCGDAGTCEAQGGPGDGDTPAQFTGADTVRGGAMYDKWWAVADADQPTDDHPFWATRPDADSNTRTGADTWRCKECHGWDYKGVNGAYSSGSHRTGINGIDGATGSDPQEVFDNIKTTHGLGDAGLTDDDIWDLVKFVLEGQIDTDDIIDGNGAFTGEAANGQTLYESGIGSSTACSGCHGNDGLTPPPGADADYGDFVGLVANGNPWEFQHKVRYGQPGTSMPATVSVDASLQDVADLSTYSQTLPEAPADDGGGPPLVGLDTNKAMILPFTVQAAYNDDTMFFHMSWEGDRGDTHDYFQYKDGAWQREGGVRRDAQATLDEDECRGSTSKNSTIYESRVTFMLDDPTGPNAVAGFGEVGCMITCHDNSRTMPTWCEEDGEVHKYLPDDVTGRLDLWHHRMARANPIGLSDDQWVGQRTGDEGDGGGGSRHGDDGTGPYATASTDDDGNPEWVFDPSTTGGPFAFPFDELFTSDLRYFVNETAADLGVNAPNPVGIDYADAVAMGYMPSEGDTVPRRRLRQTEGSRGDITATGTTFTASAGDPLFGRWDSNIQRLLDTGNGDDTALVDGDVYNIAFAVHTGMVTVRDHYVSFPYTMSLDGGDADFQAVKISGIGRDALPDFSDTAQFPVTDLNLFLPGITSYEFLIGENEGLEYFDPATESNVDQSHAGANGMLTQGLGCRACHTAASSEAFNPPQAGGFNGGAMETLAPQRGGVNTVTPLPPG